MNQFPLAQRGPLSLRGVACLLMWLVALGSTACAGQYTAEPVTAWLVDKATGKPIPDAVVVQYWNYRYGFVENHSWVADLKETVTDEQGRFHFSGWGPKRIPKELQLEWNTRLQSEDPGLMILHPDYKFRELGNERAVPDMQSFGAKVRKSDWNGKRIEMERLPDDLRERRLPVDGPSSRFAFLLRSAGSSGAREIQRFCAVHDHIVQKHNARVRAERPSDYYTLSVPPSGYCKYLQGK
jgi:hypothetical protein